MGLLLALQELPWANMCQNSVMPRVRMSATHLLRHANNESLLFDLVRFNGVVILENLACSQIQSRAFLIYENKNSYPSR